MFVRPGLVTLVLAVCLANSHLMAADHAAVEPYVSDDVVAMAYIDLRAVDLSAALDEATRWGTLSEDDKNRAATLIREPQQWCHQLVEKGVTRVYALFRVSDAQQGGPSWVLPLAIDAKPDMIIDQVRSTDGAPRVFRQAQGVLLAATSDVQLEMLRKGPADSPRPDVVAALAELGDGAAGWILWGDTNSRRVLREMFPRLSAPFDRIDGRLIADQIRWAALEVDFPPRTQATISIQTSDSEVAKTLSSAVASGLKLVERAVRTSWSEALPEAVSADLQSAFAMLEPNVETTTVRLSLGRDAESLAAIRRLVRPAVAAVLKTSENNRRINQLRQLVLAALNYESANQILPQQASYDAAGRPLLSWRVHLLPYLDEFELYKEFHLDEPWDSPHNRELIARMPAVFADPSSAVRRAVGDGGRTTFLAPVATETLFPPRGRLPEWQPLTIADITDGTSKTILFVEVVPERAVVWTKPEDWEVDWQRVTNGLQRGDRNDFTVALCDGSVRVLSNEIKAETLSAMLTRNGQEVVPW